METEEIKKTLNYLLLGIKEKYEEKRNEIKGKPRLERIAKSIGYDILEGGETTMFRVVPAVTFLTGFYAADIGSYKLAVTSFGLTALLIGYDIQRYRESRQRKEYKLKNHF
jgi:hypothetical protein